MQKKKVKVRHIGVERLSTGRHVKSTEPRKADIVASFKEVTGARKVTLLSEISPGVFQAHCLNSIGGGKFESMGWYVVEIK